MKHESPNLPEEQRLIGQPYVPQSVVITPETSVVWFNGDVDHDRRITLAKGDKIIFEGDEFEFNNSYGPIRLNETGDYNYYETNVIDDDSNFIMQGNISVIGSNDTSVASPSNEILNNNRIIVGSLMVPTQDLQQYTSQLQNSGLKVDDSYNFMDLMSGQEGEEGEEGGDEQTLLIWTANSNEVGLSQVIQALQGITDTLPYG